MPNFCEFQFWDSKLTWYTDNPRFTPCFEATVLTISPFLFLTTVGLVDIFQILRSTYRSKTFRSNFTLLMSAKTLVTGILIVFQLVQFLRLVIEVDLLGLWLVDWVSPLVQMLGYLFASIMCFYTKSRRIHSSASQFFFWMSSCLAQGILFYTSIDQLRETYPGSKENIILTTRLIVFPLIVIRFVLELISERHDVTCTGKNPSPDKYCSFFSNLFLLWYESMAWTGYKKTLTEHDLWDLNAQDSSKTQSDHFSKYWKEEVSKSCKKSESRGNKAMTSVLIPLWKCFGKTFAFGCLLRFTGDLLVFVQPLIIRALVSHVKTNIEPSWKGYFYVVIIVSTSCCRAILSASSHKKSQLTAMRVKSTLSNAVFRKTLKISNTSRKESSLGAIVNLQSVDAQRLSELIPFLNALIGSPFQIIIASYLLYGVIGPSAFVGIAILMVTIPLSLSAVSLARKYQGLQMKLKDERVKLTSELVSGIKVLKLYAWEVSFQNRIEDIRKKELTYLRKIAILTTYTVGMNHFAPILVTLGSFATFVFSDPNHILNAEKAFVALNLFNIMKSELIVIPTLFGLAIQASVSLQRLNTYLNLEELDAKAVTHDSKFSDPITVRNANLFWNIEQITLRNINFNVKKGELVAIVGRIGSGKSSLLSALLGDLNSNGGIVNVNGTISYVSQSAWIQNASLKANILFLDPLNETRYQAVVDSCALKPDLEQLPNGDETEIGENGINLSGGQKQRVALARSGYKDADIYLFDDPLSAVDAHAGKHIFENLIGPNGLLKQKTRVLVTHSITFLPTMDRIFVMKNGEIIESGTYNELLTKRGEFADFLVEHMGILNKKDAWPEVSALETPRKMSSNWEREAHQKSGTSIKLIQQEQVAEGNIKLRVFTSYFKEAGLGISIFAFSFHLLANVLTACANIWLLKWVSLSTLEQLETGKVLPEHTAMYLGTYGLIVILEGLCTFIGIWGIALVSLAASKTLQSAALSRVIRAPMSYFDTTLMGRLINRFSKDVNIIDNMIPLSLRVFTIAFFHVITIFCVIAYTNPPFMFFIIPTSIFYIILQRFYVATSRQLKRLDGITRSPIYSHFSETLSGSSVIRAFRLQEQFILDSERKVDLNQMALFPFLLSKIWIAIRLELIGVAVILSTCLFILMARDSLSPGSAGLAITYACQVTTILSIMARFMSDLESNIVAAERVEELTRVPQETQWEIAATTPSASWPDVGEVRLEIYETRYRPGLPLVLKGISCTIHAGEKIGVVGRTGAGKSSLTLGLFRLIESSRGSIFIDGLDISTLGLHALRKKVTIIPQDPVIFSGPLRMNLDPFDEYPDDALWKCLEHAHLKTFVLSVNGQLLYELEEEGKNLSVGQRQLICLARALLRKTRILILDEATAAVDLETDDLIQATIRKEFCDCTVITIAHRLNTIMDSNRVLVLDKGEIREFDSPVHLLKDPTSLFWRMARDAKLI